VTADVDEDKVFEPLTSGAGWLDEGVDFVVMSLRRDTEFSIVDVIIKHGK